MAQRAPDDQLWIDVGKLIRNGIPDKDGNVLPPDPTTGAYRLRDLAETPSPSLYEGKVVTDKTYGHATYGCMGAAATAPRASIPIPCLRALTILPHWTCAA